MRTRPLGDTGLRVTPVGLGLAALGRPAYLDLGHERDLPADRSVDGLQAHTHAMLDHAWDLGIRYVDAARSYGKAESFLAGWLAADPDRASAVTVGSKWGYTYVGDWQVDADEHEVKDHGLATFQRQRRETAATLGHHLDLYQVHSATRSSGILEDRAVLAALCELADAGVVVGLTVSGTDQAGTVRRALEVEVDGVNPFRTVQATWNVLEPSAGPALAEASAAGWGVIVKETVANGRLTERGGPLAPLRAVAERLGAPLDAVAIAAVLAQPWADVALSGAATPEQLSDNVSAVELSLDGDDLRALSSLAEPPDAYWSRRDDLAWT